MLGLPYLHKGAVIGIVLGLLAGVGEAFGEKVDSTSQKYYEAYYLEHAKGDHAGAAKLYEAAAADRSADAGLRAAAQARAAACREELATADLARLMPPDAFVYAEVSRPGDQLLALLRQLGLVGADGAPIAPGQRRLAVSPELVKAVLGIRGIGVAITGIDPAGGEPQGVAVIHPGDVDIIRGAIETAVPAAGVATEPIEGYPTFSIEGEVFVSLTKRLAVVSPDRAQIAGVLRRLNGAEPGSIADNKMWQNARAGRSDQLVTVCVNAKAVMPMIKALIAEEDGPQAVQVAQAILDLDSIQSISAGLAVGAEGLSIDAQLQLDEGHRSLAFNFLRMPRIDAETLKCIPAGVAAFAVGAMNDAPTALGETAPGAPPPPVTFLDLGREIFANIAGFGVYVLPPDGSSAPSPMPIPDVAAVFTVRDPAMSKALWTQLLGLASLAAGGATMEGTSTTINGVEMVAYHLPEGITIHFATMGNDLLVSPSRSAITRSIAAKREGRSVLSDEALAKGMARLSDNSTKAVMAHIGRVAKVAEPFMSKRDRAEAAPFFAALSDTVVSVVVDHSDNRFRLSATVAGVPQIGEMLSALLTQELGSGHVHVGGHRAHRVVEHQVHD